MKRIRRHGYYRNGKLRGYCSHEAFGRAKQIAARMKAPRQPACPAHDEGNLHEQLNVALMRTRQRGN